MKTFIKTFALALTIGAVSLSTVQAAVNPGNKIRKEAHATFQTSIYPSSVSPVVNVAVEKEEGSTVQVRFKAKSGEILSAQTLGRSKDKVSMKFRVDELPDGVYVVEVTNGRDITTKEVKLSTRQQESPRTIALN